MQEASEDEMAPLQESDTHVITNMLRVHGPDPKRWDVIAASLPGRKPHTLARLWDHHVAGPPYRFCHLPRGVLQSICEVFMHCHKFWSSAVQFPIVLCGAFWLGLSV